MFVNMEISYVNKRATQNYEEGKPHKPLIRSYKTTQKAKITYADHGKKWRNWMKNSISNHPTVLEEMLPSMKVKLHFFSLLIFMVWYIFMKRKFYFFFTKNGRTSAPKIISSQWFLLTKPTSYLISWIVFPMNMMPLFIICTFLDSWYSICFEGFYQGFYQPTSLCFLKLHCQ